MQISHKIPIQVRTLVLLKVPGSVQATRLFCAILFDFGRFQRGYAPETHLVSRFLSSYKICLNRALVLQGLLQCAGKALMGGGVPEADRKPHLMKPVFLSRITAGTATPFTRRLAACVYAMVGRRRLAPSKPELKVPTRSV